MSETGTTEVRARVWAEIQPRLQGDRAEVYTQWMRHGPCTTRELAERTEMSILSLRPRTTELFQMGLLVIESGGREGIYRAVSKPEWEVRAKRAGMPEQMALL